MAKNTPKFKMSKQFTQEQNKITLPRFSSVDVEFVKEYLYVDYDEDDMLIRLLVESAREFILSEAGLTEATELDESRIASILVLQIVSDLYNGRSTLSTDTKISHNPLYTEMIKRIRGQYKGYKF